MTPSKKRLSDRKFNANSNVNLNLNANHNVNLNSNVNLNGDVTYEELLYDLQEIERQINCLISSLKKRLRSVKVNVKVMVV